MAYKISIISYYKAIHANKKKLTTTQKAKKSKKKF
jgi:hypothetical protein